MSIPAWLKTVLDLTPLILGLTPLAPISPFVAAGITAAEQIPGASGPQKLAIAKAIVNASVQATNVQAGHQVVDPVIIDAAVTNGINTVVAVTNLIHPNESTVVILDSTAK